jgi:hypothetical protein
VIKELPQALDELIAWRYPDALWIEAESHSPQCYVIWVLDLDYTYSKWLATLSLDGRWTLSPRSETCYDEGTNVQASGTGILWASEENRT